MPDNNSVFNIKSHVKKNPVIRDIAPIQSDAAGNTLLSFCEALASNALKQGLKEGLSRTNDLNLLKVEATKPPRRQSLLHLRAVERFEPHCMNVEMAVTESEDSHMCKLHVPEEPPVDKDLHNLQGGKKVHTNSNIEFVALNVQALGQISVPRCSEVFQSNDSDEMQLTSSRVVHDIVRSATDFDLKSKRNGNGYRRPGYDPCSIYDITEFPSEVPNEALTSTMRSASASGHLLSDAPARSAPQVPLEMMSFLEEPLLLVGPKLEWEGHVNARKMSNAKRRKRQQHMTPLEQKKLTRVVIGYTLAFFLLVIVTFYIVYFF